MNGLSLAERLVRRSDSNRRKLDPRGILVSSAIPLRRKGRGLTFGLLCHLFPVVRDVSCQQEPTMQETHPVSGRAWTSVSRQVSLPFTEEANRPAFLSDSRLL
jgi:hypothetical protein